VQIDNPRHAVVVVADADDDAIAVAGGIWLGELAAETCGSPGELGEHPLATTQTSAAKTTFPNAPTMRIILPVDARAIGV
jgi:hypothetical protein